MHSGCAIGETSIGASAILSGFDRANLFHSSEVALGVGANLLFVFQTKPKFEPVGCGPAALPPHELTGLLFQLWNHP